MVKVTGKEAVKAKLALLQGDALVAQIGKALFVAANRIQVRAQTLITTGAVSGKGHVVSRPGDPPNSDTHGLDRQIETELTEPLKATVSSNARYSKFLEFGTSRMAARPFMSPAAQFEREGAVQLVRDAISRATKAPK